MSAPPSQSSSQPTATTFNERLNEQLINCLNVQTNVIQNLAQYSQHISLQLFEIKNIVEILSNRVSALQQQQQQQSHYGPPLPPSAAHFPASFYPNYPPPPSIPTSHPSSFMSHPPPPMPFGIPPQFAEPRGPAPMSNMPHGNHPSFPNSVPNHPPPPATVTSSSNVHPFQAPPTSTTIPTTLATKPITTTAASVPPVTTAAAAATTPTTKTSTAPSQSIFAELLKPNPAATNATKPAPFFPAPSSNQGSSGLFNFGSAPTFGIGFGSSTVPNSSASTVKTETHADDDDEAGGEDDSYEPSDSFKPVVKLSAVETKTGEEDENVLFCERAKLYRFDAPTNQMKERGVGEMKILQHKTTQQYRVLMRREQVLKLCANHQITPQMELKPHAGSANAFLWSAMDFADGEAKHETLCVRFKTDEQAKRFSKIFNEAKENYGKASTNGPTTNDSAAKDTTNDDDVISIGEVKPSAEQIDRAKKLQLPSTFFLYENKEPCKGCPGCEKDSPSGSTSENQPTTKTQTESKAAAPQTPATKTPLSSSENTKFSFGLTDKTQPTLQKQTSTSKDDTKSTSGTSSTPDTASAQYDNKPSIFGGFGANSPSQSVFGSAASTNGGAGISSLFGSNPLKPATNGTTGFSFPGFGTNATATTTTTTSSAPFSFATPTTSTANATSGTTSTSSPFSFGNQGTKPLFGGTGGFSFADLAKQSSSSSLTTNDKGTPNGNDQRTFAGQGSLVFGTPAAHKTPQKTNQDDDEGEGGGEDDSYEPEVSFKPIVQLSAVETKTGEEDENVLFCERAKLYRFDAPTNQMKERGVGEMKILQHKTTQQYRVLMRREQVLKLCANHQITSEMEMKQHGGSENAYVWSAMDFADGEAKHETLCIRFKTADQAKRFLKIFNEAKESHAKTHQ